MNGQTLVTGGDDALQHDQGFYDSADLRRLKSVLDRAWEQLVARRDPSVSPESQSPARERLARNIMILAKSEHDDDRLIQCAIRQIVETPVNGKMPGK